MIRAEIPIRVRFAETDAMGIVYHGNYFAWFECARIAMLDSIGLPYKTLHDKNYHLPVIEASIRYIQPAKFDDNIRVCATIRDMPSVKINVEYEVYLDDKVLCRAHTTHAFVNGQGIPVKPDKEFLEKFKLRFKE